MAVYKLFPEKDASIYSQFPLLNTGIDEILDVSTFFTSANPQVSRFLVKFSQSEIEDVLTNKIGTSSFQSNFKNLYSRYNGFKFYYYFRSISCIGFMEYGNWEIF